jgi:hypothetical protein
LEAIDVVETIFGDDYWDSSLFSTKKLVRDRNKNVRNPNVLNNQYLMYKEITSDLKNESLALPGMVSTKGQVRLDLRTSSKKLMDSLYKQVRRIVNTYATNLPGDYSTIWIIRKMERSSGAKGDSFWWWLVDLQVNRYSEFP